MSREEEMVMDFGIPLTCSLHLCQAAPFAEAPACLTNVHIYKNSQENN